MSAEKVVSTWVWYIEVIGGNTNEIAMEHLAKTCDATPDKFEHLKDCAGIPHELLCVKRSFINILEKNVGKFKLVYRIYMKRQGDRCVRLWKYESKKKMHRTKKFKNAEKELRRIQEKTKK